MDSTSSGTEEDDVDIWKSPRPGTSTSTSEMAGKSVLTPNLAASLDRAKVSDRKATFILASAAQSLGHDQNDLAINRSTIRKQRQVHRQKIAESLKAEFKPTVPLMVHWDGKLLPDLTGKDLVDCLPIIVSGADVQQLLGVPKLPGGTGELMANAIHTTLEQWDWKTE